ncbi:MAG: hypothetical protein ACC645_18525 [Pirellulales bacterium]
MLATVLQVISVVALAGYLVAWWYAVWLSTGRCEQFVVPLLGVLLVGLGVPGTVVSVLASAGHGRWLGTAVAFWAVVPLVIIGCHLAVTSRRSLGRKNGTKANAQARAGNRACAEHCRSGLLKRGPWAR